MVKKKYIICYCESVKKKWTTNGDNVQQKEEDIPEMMFRYSPRQRKDTGRPVNTYKDFGITERTSQFPVLPEEEELEKEMFHYFLFILLNNFTSTLLICQIQIFSRFVAVWNDISLCYI